MCIRDSINAEYGGPFWTSMASVSRIAGNRAMNASSHSILSATRRSVWEEIVAMYDDDSSYGKLTQLDHALQAADLAVRHGSEQEVVVAALLHDIGWKLSRCEPTKLDFDEDKMETPDCCEPDDGSLAEKLGILALCAGDGSEEQQRAQHDVIGATFLRMRGFSERVAHLVEGHVLAKRYLCFKEPEYYDKLSPASKATLAFQGSNMSAAEAELFEGGDMFEMCKLMRTWDEQVVSQL
eukprot:TRINITY_DN17102_c0_g1_i5.p1 TRINITY_DN17102_c0_g1~~TRINITY_DN17102_c0_g1_i5.p1  ORF type:complete len:238 (+),score=65.14 TRINITY_DN17102_c0_g1_i5:180-893(+)